ncbi:MAG: IS630 family transposase [Alkalinema sp. CAN_BIN05]|nr:IS630 family transposase [Alkalinema sp. CAN_BIN05]
MSTLVKLDLDQVIRQALETAATPPQTRTEPALPCWTLKRLVLRLWEKFQIKCCRNTVRQVLKCLGFSWKKARKLLNKANTEKRLAYLEVLKGLMKKALDQDHLLVFTDEAHIHLDTDEGYGWSIKGERFWISSCSPGLKKVSFYGIYIYNLGQVRIWPYDRGNGVNTIDVLKRLRNEFPDRPMTVVWDGAPYHRSQAVFDVAAELNIDIQRLPAYSPDFMPVEHLWQWLREDVTYHTCFQSQTDLIKQVAVFQTQINQTSLAIVDRLWMKNHLVLTEEKLRVSS